MGYVKINYREPFEVGNQDGARFRIGPGEVNGIAHLGRFSDPERPEVGRLGLLEVMFAFADRAGWPFTSRSVIAHERLWPDKKMGVELAEAGPIPHCSTRTALLNTRRLPTLRADGKKLKTNRGLNRVIFDMLADGKSLRIRMSVYPGEQIRGRGSNDHLALRVRYELPIERFLWRPDATVRDDGVAIESERHVFIKPLPRPRTSNSGIDPSPIDVVGADGGPYPSDSMKAPPPAPLPRPPKDLAEQWIAERMALPWSSARRAIASVDEPLELRDQSGTVFRVGPGEIHGAMRLSPHPNADHDFFEVAYAFADASGSPWVHLNTLHPYLLWPGEDVRVRPAPDPIEADLTLKLVLDTTGTPPLRFEDGREVVNHHKYNDVTYELRVLERSIAVRLSVYIGDLTKGNEYSFLHVAYELPFERLLWRGAPTVYEDDLGLEDEAYCALVRGQGGELPKLEPSPVEAAG
jgi:hypothetical protein